MRVPLSWLRDYVDIELEPEQLAQRLTLLGMEVQGIERWGADWHNVVIGELLTVEKHPRADRLSLTTVTLGSGEPLEIVCGATNIAPGQRIPVALPGAVLPGDRRIERTEKMGIVSNGMLCSGEELRMTADGEGILILPADAPLGMALAERYGDVVLDVDVKPNRGDVLSLIGLAREVSALTGAPVRFPETDPEETGADIAGLLSVSIEDVLACRRFVGRHVAGVTVRPSPDRVQMRLMAAGQRPVSNVVDVSNYVMLELGKPIHTFDAAGVRDGRIIVRAARPGESLETLDHVTRELHPETLLIADADGPLAIAGVMGGASSEIGPETRDVVIESAIFDPVSIRGTAFRYALRSEASLRFEKGQEHRLARLGADRTARLIAEWAGGQVARGVVDTDPSEPPRVTVAFRPARVERLLGVVLPVEEQRDLLTRVGIATEDAGPDAQVTIALEPQPLTVPAGDTTTLLAHVPTWRRDLAIEADITEEVARVRGYDVIQGFLPHTAMPAYRPSPLRLRDRVRELLVGAGLHEVVGYALVAPAAVQRSVGLDDSSIASEGIARGRPIVVTNPLSSQHSVMRQELLGGLFEIAAENRRRGRDGVAIFEIGSGYGATDDVVEGWWRLGFALAGPTAPPSWDRTRPDWDLDDAKGLLELVADRLGLPGPAYTTIADDPRLHPGRAARVAAGDGLAGRLGELHPTVADEADLGGWRVIVGQVAIAGLSAGTPPVPVGRTPSRHPAASRDLAIVVGDAQPAADVESAIRRHGGPLLMAVTLFDVYRGRPLADDRRSLAYRLMFSAPDRTLTEDEVDAAVTAVTAGVAADVGGVLRT